MAKLHNDDCGADFEKLMMLLCIEDIVWLVCNCDFVTLQTGALKLQDLSLAEEIGIIDSTLSCLVSWLEGHSLAQTVFTNLYLHKPHHIEDRVMKAFSISIFKIVDIIKDFVNR
jgi:hypothetical protein